MATLMSPLIASSTPTDSLEFEPDEEFKRKLRDEITSNLSSMVEDAKKQMFDKLKESVVTEDEREIISKEHHEAMDTIRKLAESQFQIALERERQERRWASGEQMDAFWSDVMLEEQKVIMQSIEKEKQEKAKQSTQPRSRSVSTEPSTTDRKQDNVFWTLKESKVPERAGNYTPIRVDRESEDLYGAGRRDRTKSRTGSVSGVGSYKSPSILNTTEKVLGRSGTSLFVDEPEEIVRPQRPLDTPDSIRRTSLRHKPSINASRPTIPEIWKPTITPEEDALMSRTFNLARRGSTASTTSASTSYRPPPALAPSLLQRVDPIDVTSHPTGERAGTVDQDLSGISKLRETERHSYASYEGRSGSVGGTYRFEGRYATQASPNSASSSPISYAPSAYPRSNEAPRSYQSSYQPLPPVGRPITGKKTSSIDEAHRMPQPSPKGWAIPPSRSTNDARSGYESYARSPLTPDDVSRSWQPSNLRGRLSSQDMRPMYYQQESPVFSNGHPVHTHTEEPEGETDDDIDEWLDDDLDDANKRKAKENLRRQREMEFRYMEEEARRKEEHQEAKRRAEEAKQKEEIRVQEEKRNEEARQKEDERRQRLEPRRRQKEDERRKKKEEEGRYQKEEEELQRKKERLQKEEEERLEREEEEQERLQKEEQKRLRKNEAECLEKAADEQREVRRKQAEERREQEERECCQRKEEEDRRAQEAAWQPDTEVKRKDKKKGKREAKLQETKRQEEAAQREQEERRVRREEEERRDEERRDEEARMEEEERQESERHNEEARLEEAAAQDILVAKRAEEEVKRKEEEVARKELEARRREVEAAKKEEEAMRMKEEARLKEEEAKRKEDFARMMEEQIRLREEKLKQREDELRRREEELEVQRDEKMTKPREEERKRVEEAARSVGEDEKRAEEAAKRREDEKVRAEEGARRREEERWRRVDEVRRKVDDRKREEKAAKRREDEKVRAEEVARRREEERWRQIDEARRKVDGRKKEGEEDRRKEEEKLKRDMQQAEFHKRQEQILRRRRTEDRNSSEPTPNRNDKFFPSTSPLTDHGNSSSGRSNTGWSSTYPHPSSTRSTAGTPKPTAGGNSYSQYVPMSEAEFHRRQAEQAHEREEKFRQEQARLAMEEQDKQTRSGKVMSKQDVIKLFELHKGQWDKIQNLSSIIWEDFPWPMFKKPKEPDDLTKAAISAYVLSQWHPSDKSTKERIKDSLRKWHPDRFNHLMPRVKEEDKERVQEGAGSVVRALNDLLRSGSHDVFS